VKISPISRRAGQVLTLLTGDLLDAVSAVVAAWLPGTEGTGVADVLTGAARPAGKRPQLRPAVSVRLRPQLVKPRAARPLPPSLRLADLSRSAGEVKISPISRRAGHVLSLLT
jgi:hypothetical protein